MTPAPGPVPAAPEARVRSGAVVAVLERRGRFLVAEPLFERGPRLVVGGHGGARRGAGGRPAAPGDLVLVRAGRQAGGGRGQAVVAQVIGRPDVARDVLEGLMLHRGLRRRFDAAVEREAVEAARRPRAGAERRDLRDLATFTIDPASARDFDDAISARELEGGGRRVWVHIADVAAHVPPGSLVDREARRRATSVYVPGAVEPMLPAALSDQACSLVPGEDRAAVTVEMDLDGARVTRVRFDRSVIRSDARLDYDRVDRVFAGAEHAREPWAGPLGAAREAARALAQARARRAALVVEGPEPEFEFDADGQVTAARDSVATESHRLIEHLMIAANEQVAQALGQARTPALYRVHEPPDPAAVERLVEQLVSLEVPTPPVPERMSPTQAAVLVGEVSELVDGHVRRTGRGRRALTALILRALRQARYDPRNLGHSGLRSPGYCHFTSPIRRYPDLVCHRALLSLVGAGEIAPRAADLPESALWASARERDAMALERAADDVARCFLLERELRSRGGERDFEGEVVGLVGAGAFVAFGGGHEGFLPVRRLRGEWWELNQPGTILHGTRSGRAIRLGDPVRVEVERVEAARGRVDLLPVEV